MNQEGFICHRVRKSFRNIVCNSVVRQTVLFTVVGIFKPSSLQSVIEAGRVSDPIYDPNPVNNASSIGFIVYSYMAGNKRVSGILRNHETSYTSGFLPLSVHQGGSGPVWAAFHLNSSNKVTLSLCTRRRCPAKDATSRHLQQRPLRSARFARSARSALLPLDGATSKSKIPVWEESPLSPLAPPPLLPITPRNPQTLTREGGDGNQRERSWETGGGEGEREMG